MDRPHALPGRRRKVSIWIILLVIFVVLTVLGRLGGLVVDWLWFQSVGLQSVFSTRLFAQVVLFFVAAVAFFILYLINMLIAFRVSPRRDIVRVLMAPYPQGGASPLLRTGFILAGIVLSVFVGLGIAGAWDTVLRYLHPASFGVTDPLFGKDISFFVFNLPVYQLLQGFLTSSIFLIILSVIALHFIRFVLPQLSPDQSLEGQLQTLQLDVLLGPAVKAHLSILVALFAVLLAIGNWLAIYSLVFSSTGLFFGANFTDVNARWPALWLLVAAALLFAVLVVLNIRRRGYSLVVAGLAIWLAVWILAGGIYPGLVQRLQVQPSEFDKEQPYLRHNINFTNQAYRLDKVSEVEYAAQDAVSLADINANPATINNVRLLDPIPLLSTYNQIQSIRLYYDFADIDIDRYVIDGEYRQVMLSARELSPDKLPSQAQTWVNRRLQFTHGYGVAMSPVNEVTPEGLPNFFVQDVPPRGKLPISRPEVYYGETADDFVIVKTTTEEFDYPRGDDNVYVRYEGESGVPIGSFFSRLFFAWQFGDWNILLAGALQPDSRILFHRNIVDRVSMVAPFLRYDADPYVVVANERLYWILDAYTYTDHYPYSQPVGLGRTNVNYLRNSVKVVVDAYDGSMQFYQTDSEDPLIASYAAIFPGLFVPFDQMPPQLRAHVRYPEDLFQVQAHLYRTYHMRDPRVFYNKEDLWNIANQLRADRSGPMDPYYVIMRLPGQTSEEFTLILPFTPPDKDNMITWLAARSDGDAYGSLVAYRYPKDKLIFGPMQIEARIDQDPIISQQLSLWNQSGSRVIRGNMIVIPIGQSNLYVEPIYLQSEQTKLPEMKRVLMATGNRVVMEPTVSTALASLYQAAGTAARPPEAPQPGAPAPAPTQGPDAKSLLDRLSKLQDELRSLQTDLQQYLQSQGQQ